MEKDNYISDGRIIDCVFIDARNKGTMIYVKYGDEAVGKYIGEIFLYKDRYMYYDYSEQIVTVLTDGQLELLQEYL